MDKTIISKLRNDIASIGRLLWDKNLASGLNGNISARVEAEKMLLTGHGTCLGMLKDQDILLATVQGEVLEGGKLSTEKLLHTEIYKNFPQVNAVVHTHTVYTNAYFLENQTLTPRIFESKFYLGEVAGIDQSTPSVTEAGPVIAALKKNNVVVLRQHGVVAMGQSLFDCFLLIQALEEAVTIDAVSRLFRAGTGSAAEKKVSSEIAPMSDGKKYKLFSQEQIDEIVRLVNVDTKLGEMGTKTNMTMDLAVQLNETKKTYSFRFESGRITKVGQDENAEFLISAPENVWRAVFNREIDPFVATTQKKMNLRGDFARISKWYAPCSRVFELWARVPVE